MFVKMSWPMLVPSATPVAKLITTPAEASPYITTLLPEADGATPSTVSLPAPGINQLFRLLPTSRSANADPLMCSMFSSVSVPPRPSVARPVVRFTSTPDVLPA